MLTRDVAEGVHRVQDSYVNWYIVEDGDRLTVVELTHAHYDHVGFADRLRRSAREAGNE